MTAAEVKTSLAKAARRCWPEVTRASDLPFPDYWKAVTEWLTFQAPRVGDALMWKLIDDFAVSAKEAEERGEMPATPKISDEVREIWRRAAAQDAWEHAAERADAVRSRFADRSRTKAEDNLEGKIHALTRPAQPAILTDRSKAATCGDGGRDRAMISEAAVMWQGRLL